MSEKNITTESIADGFKRIAENSPSKIKRFLLKKIGISSHEIRVYIKADSPLRGKLDNVLDSSGYYEARLFSPRFYIEDIYILNCSNTKPAVISVDIFVKIKEDNVLKFEPNKFDNLAFKSLEIWKKDFLIPDDSDQETQLCSIPLLLPGKVLLIKGGDMLRGDLTWYDLVQKYDLGNKFNSNDTSNEERTILKESFQEILNTSEIWIGIILDSKEILPFFWDWDDQEFKPGFFTDSTVIS